MEERVSEEKMENAFKYLAEEAFRRSKHGRGAILQAERDFHEALYKLRIHSPISQFHELEKCWLALVEYPAVLRSVMDAQDEANELLAQMRHIRLIEGMARDISKEPDAAKEGE